MNSSLFPSVSPGNVNSPPSKRVKTFVLQDKCFEKGIAVAWSRGNKFSVYPRSQTVEKTATNVEENKILNLQQRILLYHPVLRKLVNESNGTYLSLQKLAESVKNSDNQVEYLKISRQYRSVLRVCIEGLQEASAKESDGVAKNNLLSYVTIFYSIECIWHLSEILYVDNIPGDVVLPFLLEWVRFHFPHHEESAAALLEACERGSEEHVEYWDTVVGMVVQGRVDVARALIKLHSASEANEFKLVDNSLRAMPAYSWVRFHFPHHEESAAALLEACERGSEEHVEYWDTVVGMVVQGRVDVARALIKLHSASEANEFKLVDNSLRAMPAYSVYGGISSGEFTISWKHWQAECRSKISSGAVSSQPQLEFIMRLIIGDYAAWETVRGKYSSWFDVLGGWVLFNCPAARRHDLRAAAAACAGMRATAPQPRSQLDTIVRALLDDDLHQVIHEIQLMSDNCWFAAHLTDMLYHCGRLHILDKHQNNVTARLRESLILEYGCMLMDHQSLWPVGLSYLASVPPEGPLRAQLLLERIPLRTEAKALRIIAEAKKYGLLGVVQTVCSVMSTRHLSRSRIGGALAWGVRGRGGSTAAHAALKLYSEGGSLPAADLLLAHTSHMLANPTLLLAGKYCEFHKLYAERDFRKAAHLLVSLITSKLAPDYFWETLLLDALPLLESDEAVFSSADTYEMMSCLELRAPTLGTEKADLLRLALARNLARTCLLDGDDKSDVK